VLPDGVLVKMSTLGRAALLIVNTKEKIMPEITSLRANGHAVSRDLSPTLVNVADLKPLGNETRKHSANQIAKLARSLDEFGFVLPVLQDKQGRVVAGWGRVLAARKLELTEVPAITLSDLSEAKLRLLRLALNKLGEESDWAKEALAREFTEILSLEPHIDLDVSGFEPGEIDVALNFGAEDEEDTVPLINPNAETTAKPGDLWLLGEHRLYCGDALEGSSYEHLLGNEQVQMVFTDPPFNVPIEGHASGLGMVKHKDFASACGELSPAEFEAFLLKALRHAVGHSVDGAIHFVCMDWRHLGEILGAGQKLYAELKNLCIWNKTNGGMGSLYRSKHELVFVYKVGKGSHINNVALGKNGRNRYNVWDYAGQNALGATSKRKLDLHPTVKPVGLVADAIRDCSNLGGIILDPFGGAGTVIIAAERTKRKARLIEIEPRYVDVTIERWQRLTGLKAERGSASSEAKFPE
jgi:DNA modification methylase